MAAEKSRSGQQLNPSRDYLTVYMILLGVGSLFWGFYVTGLRRKEKKNLMRDLGVAVQKISRSVKEIERKTFHLCGLLVPFIYQTLLVQGWSTRSCAGICWVVTAGQWTFDLSRLRYPAVHEFFLTTPIGKILRKNELDQLTGASYFSLGCTLAVSLTEPAVAMTSVIFLVLGDMSAALFGVSFGGEMVAAKLGREGKKSFEGSAAMFFVCFIIGCTVFSEVRLCEYAVFIGAMVATLVELFEPFELNDNLTIPLFSSLAMEFALQRLQMHLAVD
jgi:dolichol kinase